MLRPLGFDLNVGTGLLAERPEFWVSQDVEDRDEREENERLDAGGDIGGSGISEGSTFADDIRRLVDVYALR